MLFEGLCASLIALLLGLVVCFGGYRLFLVLLPIWGFFFGFFLGAQTVQAFGGGFLVTVTSWVVGFVVGAIFGVLSYLFYIFAVAILAGSLGYALGAGFMHLIGIDAGLVVFLVGIVVAIVVAAVTIFFNIQRYVIVIATAIGGAGIVLGTLALGAGGLALANVFTNPVQAILKGSPLLFILFLILAIAGIVVQLRQSQTYEIEPYENRI